MCTITKPIQTNGTAHEGQKREKEMKKLNVGLALLVVAVCAMLSLNPMKAYADSVTLTLDPNWGDYAQYSWFSNGTQYTEAVGPYTAILNGDGYNNVPVLVICYDMQASTYVGQTYSGTIQPVTGFSSSTSTAILEATFLGNELINDGGLNAPLATRGAISTAIWQIMNPSSTTQISSFPNNPAAQSYITDAIVAVGNGSWTAADANLYSTWMPDDIYIQRFDAPSPTPEPGSLILLGTGMIGLATFLYRRRRVA